MGAGSVVNMFSFHFDFKVKISILDLVKNFISFHTLTLKNFFFSCSVECRSLSLSKSFYEFIFTIDFHCVSLLIRSINMIINDTRVYRKSIRSGFDRGGMGLLFTLFDMHNNTSYTCSIFCNFSYVDCVSS